MFPHCFTIPVFSPLLPSFGHWSWTFIPGIESTQIESLTRSFATVSFSLSLSLSNRPLYATNLTCCAFKLRQGEWRHSETNKKKKKKQTEIQPAGVSFTFDLSTHRMWMESRRENCKEKWTHNQRGEECRTGKRGGQQNEKREGKKKHWHSTHTHTHRQGERERMPVQKRQHTQTNNIAATGNKTRKHTQTRQPKSTNIDGIGSLWDLLCVHIWGVKHCLHFLSLGWGLSLSHLIFLLGVSECDDVTCRAECVWMPALSLLLDSV